MPSSETPSSASPSPAIAWRSATSSSPFAPVDSATGSRPNHALRNTVPTPQFVGAAVRYLEGQVFAATTFLAPSKRVGPARLQLPCRAQPPHARRHHAHHPPRPIPLRVRSLQDLRRSPSAHPRLSPVRRLARAAVLPRNRAPLSHAT